METADAWVRSRARNHPRDVKPDNILLEGSGPHVSPISDRQGADMIRAGHTDATGVAIGTPHYMSPEQAAAIARSTALGHLQPRRRGLQMLTGESVLAPTCPAAPEADHGAGAVLEGQGPTCLTTRLLCDASLEKSRSALADGRRAAACPRIAQRSAVSAAPQRRPAGSTRLASRSPPDCRPPGASRRRGDRAPGAKDASHSHGSGEPDGCTVSRPRVTGRDLRRHLMIDYHGGESNWAQWVGCRGGIWDPAAIHEAVQQAILARRLHRRRPRRRRARLGLARNRATPARA